VLVCALYHGRAGLLGEFLARRPSRFLGQISYGLYLFSVPLLTVATPILQGVDPLATGLPIGCLIVAAAIPIAIWSERWIERPMIQLGQRLAIARARVLEKLGQHRQFPYAGSSGVPR